MENTIISTTNPIKKKKGGLVKGSQEAKDWAKKMADARKAKSDKTKLTEPKVNIDFMGENQLILPEYFAVRRKNGFKLVNPMTKERNLSKRGGETSVKILRKPVDNAVLLEGEDHLIPLSLFSKKDRALIVAKFDKIEQSKEKPITEKPVIPMPPPVERGRPERLQRNIDINKERNQGVAKKGRPAKYKSQEEAKKAKAIKDKERYAIKKQAKKASVSGEGVNQDVNTVIHKGKKQISELKERVSNIAKEVYYGATKLPLPIQKLLKKYGDEEIVSLKLMRTPVPKVLSGVLTLFSGGKFGKKMKENNFDTLFHLFIEATLKSGNKVELEKNERITMLLNPKLRPKTEVEPIEKFPSGLTLNKLLKNTEQKMGNNFLTYSARDNNCQDFLASLLTSNNLGTPQDMSFVKQDTKTLFEDLPYLRKFANTLTDIGAKASAIISGGSIDLVNRKRLTKNNISNNNIKMPKFKDTRFQPPTDYVIPQDRFSGNGLLDVKNQAKFVKPVVRKPVSIEDLKNKPMINPQQLAMLNGEDTEGKMYPAVMIQNPYYKKMTGMGRGKKMSDCEPCPMCSGSGMCGSGFFDDIGRAFRSVGNKINKAVIQPVRRGVEKEIIAPVESGVKKTFTPKLGRDITSGLIHTALPAVISGIASTGTTALTGNPALGFAVGQTAGKVAGKQAGDALGKATGYGLKKPNAWIELVKKVQKEKGVSYKEALSIASQMKKQ